MGGRHVHLLPVLLYAAGLFYNCAVAHTEDLKTRYLRRFVSAEDSTERQLINDLHGVLERLKNGEFPSYEKKQGYLQMCEPGDQCAMRKGSRIGKLCDCSLPRTCNSFLLRCL